MISPTDAGRRLTAVLVADVVGYSRLMANDEAGTIARLKSCRRLFADRTAAANGRVVNAPGDSVLAEFSSVQDAVRCAVDIQHALSALNEDVPEDEQMRYRIGINLGDVTVDEDGIYGDGVNVAARLESLAEPGGVTLSGSVYDSVRDHVPFVLEETGEQRVKNIAHPVRTYRVVGPAGETRGAPGTARARMRAAIAVVVVLASAALWLWSQREPGNPGTAARNDPSHTGSTPSVAVLPFRNMSGDPAQQYFSGGLTDTVVTALADLRDITVITPSATAHYRGDTADVRAIGREFNVRHVLDGSVQKAADRIRVNVQLVDAVTGAQIWGENYDREFLDLLEVQDEITTSIIAALDVTLVEGEQATSWRSSTDDPYAYELFLEGWEARQRMTREDTDRAMRLFEAALERDPEFTAALFGLGTTHMAEAYSGWSASAEQSFGLALDYANAAIENDPTFGGAHNLLGELLIMFRRDHGQGIEHLRRAVALTPSSARYNWTLGVYLCNAGEHVEGLSYVERGFRLNPHPPAWFYQGYGRCYLLLDRFEASIGANRKSVAVLPDFIWSHVGLAAAHIALGQEDEARASASAIRRIDPAFSVREHPSVSIVKNNAKRAEIVARLEKAGLS